MVSPSLPNPWVRTTTDSSVESPRDITPVLHVLFHWDLLVRGIKPWEGPIGDGAAEEGAKLLPASPLRDVNAQQISRPVFKVLIDLFMISPELRPHRLLIETRGPVNAEMNVVNPPFPLPTKEDSPLPEQPLDALQPGIFIPGRQNELASPKLKIQRRVDQREGIVGKRIVFVDDWMLRVREELMRVMVAAQAQRVQGSAQRRRSSSLQTDPEDFTLYGGSVSVGSANKSGMGFDISLHWAIT